MHYPCFAMSFIRLLLDESVETWNQWRVENPNAPCSLAGEDLSSGYFYEGDFSGANLQGVNLQRACLIGADLRWADLRGANLNGAYLDEANLYGANLTDAEFTGASLERANLRRVHWFGKQVACADAKILCMEDAITSPAAIAPKVSLVPALVPKAPLPKEVNFQPAQPTNEQPNQPTDQQQESSQFDRMLAWRLRHQLRIAKPLPILG